MIITYKKILLWHSALNEILNGYKTQKPLNEIFEVPENNVVQTADYVRHFITGSKIDNDMNRTIDLIDVTYEQIKIIKIALENALVFIPKWEISLRLDVNTEEIKQEIVSLDERLNNFKNFH
jgi:hypothetical protein